MSYYHILLTVFSALAAWGGYLVYETYESYAQEKQALVESIESGKGEIRLKLKEQKKLQEISLSNQEHQTNLENLTQKELASRNALPEKMDRSAVLRFIALVASKAKMNVLKVDPDKELKSEKLYTSFNVRFSVQGSYESFLGFLDALNIEGYQKRNFGMKSFQVKPITQGTSKGIQANLEMVFYSRKMEGDNQNGT